MKQKPLQRLLSRVVMPRMSAASSVLENAVSHTPMSSRVRRGCGAEGGGTVCWDGAPALAQTAGESCFSTAMWWRGTPAGEQGERKRAPVNPWGVQPWRAYAAPAAAASKTGKSGGGEGVNKADRRINRAIVARMVRLVGTEGHEILSRYEALNRAQQEGLDLVEVDGKADPPVCKLMDFSKERFKVKRQEKELRKKQLERRRLDDLKEVRFSSRTEQKDLELKTDIVTRLLVRGHRVKLVVQFHGNDKGEVVGVELLERAMTMLEADMKVENGPRVEKMRAWVMIRPIVQEQKSAKKKAVKTSNESVDVEEEDTDVQVVKAVEG